MRPLLIACAFLFAHSPAFAGASSNALPPPDPTAAHLTPQQIQTRAYDACLIVQARLQGTTREAVQSPCSCYARRTINRMTKAEIAAFRATGYFDDATREKALEEVDRCGLRRPI